ncbi:MFS multidrug transporter [Penicillium hispanicum]|uniref:MFS multidrug transporter n=1 Tax=Penicillium hispanicum TaxID=1080232 RepID=UPI0025401D5C|nr:MFS multidrug transporter [Penicillium hispanicum]KAJ5570009.1 MFS multidrug transporter [Penicillium hispanicum]
MMTFCVTFASSVFSAADASTAKEFGVSDEVMILGTSLFVLGYALGPIVFGPLSEVFGRKWPLFIGFAAFAIFQIPVAVAQNLQTIMLCRFLGGVFGSSPLAIVGGNLADMFGPVDRGVAIAIFASGTFIGPVAGPIVGGFVNMSYLGWRWTAWITLIMAAFFGLLGLFLVPETFGPVILTSKARRLRFKTKNWAIHAAAEEQQVELSNIVQRYLLRPFRMLLQEPTLTLITLYMGFIYGFLYLCFEAYPIAFQEVRGWNQGVGQFPFLAITVGVLIGVAIIIYFTKTRYQRLMLEMGAVSPEERLPPMMLSGFFLPVGMFWFGWTYYASISWVPQVLSGAAIGGGILLIFMQV